jgi:predicted amino acid dehydrogenase
VVPPLDFALIGHAESWEHAASIVSGLRAPNLPPLSAQDTREILPWIPPRVVCRGELKSKPGRAVRGAYIDCFMPPDRLDRRFLRENLARVREAAECAIREGARVAALGGFSSILLEGNTNLLPPDPGSAFTTGNTLAVALIVRGIERAVACADRDLRETDILIVGASGDVGSGCARCLGPRAGRLLLCARNPERLRGLWSELREIGADVEMDTDLRRLTPRAHLVVCVASTPAPDLWLESLPAGALICDAGYPKNLSPLCAPRESVIFFGGMGQFTGALQLEPDLSGPLCPYPFPHVFHGCMLEGMVLAMAGRYEAFSQGRGHIFPPRVEEIWAMASDHGVVLPPLFDRKESVEARISALASQARR